MLFSTRVPEDGFNLVMLISTAAFGGIYQLGHDDIGV
jgi:hypothetical protein